MSSLRVQKLGIIRMTFDKPRNFITFARVGFAASGITYMLLGFLALDVTNARASQGQPGVFNYIQSVPGGLPILWAIAVGMLAFALFKLLNTAADLERNGSDAKGLARRVGSACSGVVHLFLAYAAYRFAIGAHPSQTGAQQLAAPVMDIVLGNFLIGLAGAGMIVAAFVQAKDAVTAGFMRHVSSQAPEVVEWIGRAGHAARGAVFAVIGWSLVRGAWFDSESAVKGLGEALMSLHDLGALFTAVAIGLVMFGAFSLITARYRIIPDFCADDIVPKN